MIRILTLMSVLIAAPATAQMAQFCDWVARADGLVEPWEDHTRTFANGNVRLALMDTVEPAAGSFHILIISPPLNELGERQCKTVGMSENIGFSNVDFRSLEADYDPATGLIFRFDIETYNGEYPVPGRLKISLNQATGDIRAELQ